MDIAIDKKNLKYTLAILSVFVLLPNLISSFIAFLAGIPRPLIYYEYFLLLIPLCFSARRIIFYISTSLLVILTIYDTYCITMAGFNFSRDEAEELTKQGFFTFEYIYQIVVDNLSSDLRIGLVYVCVILMIFLLSWVSSYKILQKKMNQRSLLKSLALSFFISLPILIVLGNIYSSGMATAVLTFFAFLFAAAFFMIPKASKYNSKVRLTFVLIFFVVLYITSTLIYSISKNTVLAESLIKNNTNRIFELNKGFSFNMVKYDFKTDFAFKDRNIESGSRFITDKIAGQKYDKIILVITESMGLYKNGKMNDVQFSPLADAELNRFYNVSFDKSKYKGFTVQGEFRELCRATFENSFPRNSTDKNLFNDCLPSLLESKGYETYGVHNSYGRIFNRNEWYPKLGFNKIYFLDDIKAKFHDLPICGVGFPGICEKEMFGKVIPSLMDNDQKQFIYFLTVEAHTPVKQSIKVTDAYRQSCLDAGLNEKLSLLCKHSFLHTKMLSEIKDMLLSTKDKNVLMVIVGDHAPPFYYKKYNEQYDKQNIPVIIIESKH